MLSKLKLVNIKWYWVSALQMMSCYLAAQSRLLIRVLKNYSISSLWLPLSQNNCFLAQHKTNITCIAIATAITGFENAPKNSISIGYFLTSSTNTNLTFRRGKHSEIKNMSKYYITVDRTSCGVRQWHVCPTRPWETHCRCLDFIYQCSFTHSKQV